MSWGFFWALEGLDGAGKTSLALSLKNALKAKGIDVVICKEPSLSCYGQKLRAVLKDGRPVGFSPLDELELFTKDRVEDLAENIFPALTAGRTVIVDRYILSSVAYQGALGLDPKIILKINQTFTWPSATFILDISPQLGLERVVKGRGDTPNAAFEKLDYLTKVAAIFQSIDAYNLPHVYRLNAESSLEDLTNQALAIMSRFKEPSNPLTLKRLLPKKKHVWRLNGQLISGFLNWPLDS
ncbi:MAG: dTMP kinase [Deltaproteobacteria bacterium]|jgi:dTMP kinase|nr:dTMP kinase [Deltaproteobacteria bacterium]